MLNSPPRVSPKLATNPYRYFINVEEKLKKEEKKEEEKRKEEEWDDFIIFYSEKDSFFSDFQGTIKNEGFNALLKKEDFRKFCFEKGIIPFASLSSDGNLYDWLDDYEVNLIKKKGLEHDNAREKKRKIRSIFEKYLNYQIPILILQNTDIIEVAEIFERINKTGVELSVFAIATAVFYNEDCNLRKWWEDYYNQNGLIKKFCDIDDENYPKYILQIMALLQEKEVKKRVLIDSSELKVDKGKWEEACKWLDKALERLYEAPGGYGVIKPNLLPYKTIVVTLSALLKHCKNDAKPNKKIDSWYWSSVFTGRYSHSSDTVVKRDFDQVKKWLKSDKEKPEVIVEIESHNAIEDLDLEKTERGALYKSIMNLLALKIPRDFFSGKVIKLLNLDDHHIFPKKVNIPNIDRNKLNSILNRTLIGNDTDKSILNKKPSEYLKIMRNKLDGEENLKKTLESHIINNECYDALKENKYEEFIKEREKLIKEEMKKLAVSYKE